MSDYKEELNFFEQQTLNFKNKINEFESAYKKLISIENSATLKKYPELLKEFNELKSRALRIQNVIIKVLDKIKNVKNKIKNYFGDDGIDAINGIEFETLGFAISLPTAIVLTLLTGAVTAITKWILDQQVFFKKFETVDKLLESGANPQQINNILQGMDSSPISGGIENIKKIVIYAGLFFVGYKLVKRFT